MPIEHYDALGNLMPVQYPSEPVTFDIHWWIAAAGGKFPCVLSMENLLEMCIDVCFLTDHMDDLYQMCCSHMSMLCTSRQRCAECSWYEALKVSLENA